MGFTEFDILENYRKSFKGSELGRLHSVFPFERMAKAAGLSDRRLGRRNIFSLSANLDINHDLYASAIRKSQDHPYLYSVRGLGGRASELLYNELCVSKCYRL